LSKSCVNRQSSRHKDEKKKKIDARLLRKIRNSLKIEKYKRIVFSKSKRETRNARK